jgi:hypothetical protein
MFLMLLLGPGPQMLLAPGPLFLLMPLLEPESVLGPLPP